MKRFIVSLIFIVMMFLVSNPTYAQNCSGSGCSQIDAQVTNNIAHEQNSVLYYNNNARSTNFVQPHSPHRVYLPTYFTDHQKHSSNYIAIMNLIQFKDTFTRQELKKLVEDGDTDVTVHLINESSIKSQVLTVLYPADGVGVPQGVYIGTFVGKVDDSNDGSSSIHAFAAACLKALDAGVTVVFINQEGAERILRSYGGGVGFSYTRGSVGGGGNNSAVASGGTGFSWGHAKYEEEPFIHLTGLVMTPEAILERKTMIKNAQAEIYSQTNAHTNGDKRQVMQQRRSNIEGNTQ